MHRFPQLVIENCGSGGGRMDYAMLAHHQLQSSSDQTDYRKYPAIVAGGLAAVLPEQFAVWSYPKAMATPTRRASTWSTRCSAASIRAAIWRT